MHFVNDYMEAFLWLGGNDIAFAIIFLAFLGLGVITTVVLIIKGIPFIKDFKERPFFPDSFASKNDDGPSE